MNTEVLKRAILREFDTLGDCAAAIGMSKSQFSRSLKQMNAKFLARLEEAGIRVEEPQDSIKGNSEIGEYRIIIKELKNIIYEKNSLIEEQRSIIDQKNDIIKQYEELTKK